MMKLSEAESSSSTQEISAWGQQSAESTSLPSGKKPPRLSAGWIGVGVLSLGCVGLIVAISIGMFDRGPAGSQSPTSGAIPANYDPIRAFGYLQQLCELGPRPSGTPAMQRQQEMLRRLFSEQGANVSMQTFEIRHPEDGSSVPMANLIASWHVDRPKRFLLCAHYDTRPYPDSDRRNRRGVFVGANDGASGTAALIELGHQLSDLPADVGVDIVLFDGEEFVFEQGRDEYFLGSKFFANHYRAQPPVIPYRGGILLDMIGDRELKIYYEKNSLRYARDLARSIWRTAEKLGVRAFVSRSRHTIDDDHIPLNQIARIPTVDLIDFDYPRPGIGAPSYWHTEQDIPENCSGQSLAAVVWVIHQWLKQQ
jgi:hypothetical protein